MLRYSDRKERVIKNARTKSEDLYLISNGIISVEEAVAKYKSFQNAYNINRNFEELDPQLDISGTLSKPDEKLSENPFNLLDAFFERRHRLVHKSEIRSEYTKEKLVHDMYVLKLVVQKSYQCFIDTYSWKPIQK